MTRIAIIDDEIDARYSLCKLLEKYCPEVEIVGEATGVEEGIRLIHQQNPDVVLLDIAMQDGTGFDLLDHFPRPTFKVIFTTAYDQFAIKAFKYNALDYLLKPVDIEELVAAVEKAKKSQLSSFPDKITGLLKMAKSRHLEQIALSSMEGLVFLKLEEIVHLEADGNYTTFHVTGKEKHTVVRPIKEYDNLLPPSSFYRTHQSHIVNLDFVKKFLREDGGMAVLSDGALVPVARRRRDDFLKKLTGRSL